MIYLRCPTCGYTLANREELIGNKFKEIDNNPNLTDEDKPILKTKFINEELELPRYCCKLRILTFLDLTKIIK